MLSYHCKLKPTSPGDIAFVDACIGLTPWRYSNVLAPKLCPANCKGIVRASCFVLQPDTQICFIGARQMGHP